jgi:hypothetical protein
MSPASKTVSRNQVRWTLGQGPTLSVLVGCRRYVMMGRSRAQLWVSIGGTIKTTEGEGPAIRSSPGAREESLPEKERGLEGRDTGKRSVACGHIRSCRVVKRDCAWIIIILSLHADVDAIEKTVDRIIHDLDAAGL